MNIKIHLADVDKLLHAGYCGMPMVDNPQVYEFRLSDLQWPKVQRNLDIERVAYNVNGVAFNNADLLAPTIF